MQPLPKSNRIEVEEYLRGERYSNVRHEYIYGQVFAIVGASDRHGIIAGNLHTFLNRKLPDRCQGFIADMKVRLGTAEQEIFNNPMCLSPATPPIARPTTAAVPAWLPRYCPKPPSG